MALEIEQFICRSDNYGVIAYDLESGETVIFDAPEAKPIIEALDRRGWTPTTLLITHHHGDHVAGNLELKERYRLKVIGPEKEAARIPGIDDTVREGAILPFGDDEIHVIDTPGHTAGHVSYYLPRSGIAHTADTLFALGCGRLLECGADVMFASLEKLKKLPPETLVYVGHEYTQANARFALGIDPGNAALQARAKRIDEQREKNEMTLPTTIGEELATNPFLRANDPAIRKALGMEEASDVEVFAEIRKRKDNF
ncbi:MAG: hydroxyacylglutathione hydrolase [Methylobacterium mesophilicum]|nr:hydroxyacylglutathione hydrolase [Methylobacterium mesophilicum]